MVGSFSGVLVSVRTAILLVLATILLGVCASAEILTSSNFAIHTEQTTGSGITESSTFTVYFTGNEVAGNTSSTNFKVCLGLLCSEKNTFFIEQIIQFPGIDCSVVDTGPDWAEITCNSSANTVFDFYLVDNRTNTTITTYENISSGSRLFTDLPDGRTYFVNATARKTTTQVESETTVTFSIFQVIKDNMASLSIMVLVLILTSIPFCVSFFKKTISKNVLADYVIRRLLVIFGMFLMSLVLSIGLSIADQAGLGLFDELFLFLRIVLWSIYITMGWMFFITVKMGLKMWNQLAEQIRMGDDEDGNQ
jgi:hypothetical protein